MDAMQSPRLSTMGNVGGVTPTKKVVKTDSPKPKTTTDSMRSASSPNVTRDTRKKITDTDDMLARIDSQMDKLKIENPDKRDGVMSRFGSRLKSFGKALAVGLLAIPKTVANAALTVLKGAAIAGCHISRAFTLPFTGRQMSSSDIEGVGKMFDDAKKAVTEQFDSWNAGIIRVGGLKSSPSGEPNGKLGAHPDGMLDNAIKLIKVEEKLFQTGSKDVGAGFGNFGLALGTAQALGKLEDGVNKIEQGSALKEQGQQLISSGNRDGGEFLVQQGEYSTKEGAKTLLRQGVAMAQYGVSTAGKFVVPKSAPALNLELAGNVMTAVTATYDGVVDSMSAHSGRVRKNRCDKFLGETARMKGNDKVVESLDTSVVRDGVKLFRKNQNQNFGHKALSAGRNFAVAGGAIALTAIGVATAATPVGWAIMGVTTVAAVGFGLYKTYKSVRRQENIQRLDDRLVRVQAEIQKTQDPQRLSDLKKLEHTIQRYQRQTDPAAAAKAMVHVLNNGKTQGAKDNAKKALTEVFKINPAVLTLNGAVPVAGKKAYEEAMKLLQGKMALFA